MRSKDQNGLRNLSREKLWWHLGVPLVFLVLMLGFYPFRATFEMDLDEGVNLMKGMLVVRGYTLYSQIWSDQPPLFTHMLAVLFRLVGFEVNAARVMVLILSGVLLWAGCLYLRMIWGKTAALIGLITILLLPTYLNLSVSVMVGLPALAFAMLSLLSLIAWHLQRQPVWLSLSAIALSLSVLTKLFTGFLAPVFVIGITLDEFAHASRPIRGWHILKMPVLWSGIFGGVTLLGVLALVGPVNLDQLIEPHLMAGQTGYFEAYGKSYTLWTHLAKAWPILALALVGEGIAIFERRWLAVYPFAWMVTATLLLANHTPVWSHQQLLVTLPAALLAAGAVGQAMEWASQGLRAGRRSIGRSLVLGAVLLSLAWVLWARVPETFNLFTADQTGLKETSTEYQFMKRMEKYSQETKWVVTDLPMYAFRVGLPVPPNLAVFTSKRVASGNINEAEVLDTIKVLKPKQVMIGRFKFPDLEVYLDENYRLVLSRGDQRLYLWKDQSINP